MAPSRARRIAAVALGAAVIATPAALATRGGADTADAAPVHVVSVGDSLAVGVQPGLNGAGRATGQGYPRQFARGLEARGIDVELHELGCGGATSSSVLDGGRPCAPAGDQPYDNEDRLTSQVAYAEGLLSRLSDQRTIVLVDIGGNDVGNCLQGVGPDLACVRRVGDDLRDRLGELLSRLRDAAPHGAIAVLDLYDPVLGLWDRTPTRRAAIARFHDVFRAAVNGAILDVARREHVEVGRLAEAMAQDRAVDPSAARRPPAVAEVCRLSWMCVRPPLLPDIHLRRDGYAAAATALTRALEPHLRTLENAP